MTWEKYAYSVPSAAKLVERSRFTLYKEIQAGRLKAHRPNPNGDMLILNEDLKAWLTANPYEPKDEEELAV